MLFIFAECNATNQLQYIRCKTYPEIALLYKSGESDLEIPHSFRASFNRTCNIKIT